MGIEDELRRDIEGLSLLGLVEDRNLKLVEESLIRSMHSFISFANLSPTQLESFHVLLDNFYRHGLECSCFNFQKDMIYRLQDELRKYN